MADEQPSLGQLIWLVRRELEWSRQVDEDEPLTFDVSSVELDVVVEVTRSTTGGGLDLKVFGVGGKADLSHEPGHQASSTVHVVLTTSDTRVAGHKFQVSAADTEPPTRSADTASDPEGNTRPKV